MNCIGTGVELVNQKIKSNPVNPVPIELVIFLFNIFFNVNIIKKAPTTINKPWIASSDLSCNASANPNRPAPMLIPKSMVETMAPGSVIMDLASENGGNCELTKENEIVNHNGVLIDGNSNLPSTMAYHSSQLFSKNIEAIIDHCHSEEGFKLDKEDEIIDGMLFIENGEVRHQPTKESM